MKGLPRGLSARWGVFAAAVLVAIAGVALFLRVNTTPSVQTGLYLRVPEWMASGEPQVGDLVMACPPDGEAVVVALEREYLQPSQTCEAGIVPVLKRVVAVGGQTVEVREDGLFVDGQRVADPPLTADSQGRPLVPLYGSWPLGEGAVWLGSEIPNGYDSRYFGPFARDLREGRARLLASF